jgi:anti-sigma factor ChrR (cupin superfamily)
MKETGIQDCESVQAALPEIVLGSLGADEARRLLEHVAICANCHDMLQRDADLIAHSLLSDVSLDAEVPATIKLQLMNRIRSRPQQSPGVRLERDGVLVLRTPEVPWQETELPGMQCRPFSSARSGERSMSLYRMKAGCVYPGHRHEGLEELYLLSGTLLVEGLQLNAGDYCRAELGSSHAPIVALTDCEFLTSLQPDTIHFS